MLKHLSALETDGLISTRKLGRQRFCYLNPVPLVALARRWLDDYGARWGSALLNLRDHAEGTLPPHTVHQGAAMTATSSSVTVPTTHQYSVVIAASADRIWHTLTDPEECARWYFGTSVTSTWETGAPYTYRFPDGTVAIQGSIERIERPSMLVMSFSARWDDAISGDSQSRVTWQIEPEGELCRVTVRHEHVPPGSATEAQTASGWPYLLSNLKTLLETGEPMPTSAA